MSGSYPRSGDPSKNADRHARAGLAGLIIGAIGVVFGDIGTSPLYTLKQAFTPHYGLTPTHIAVLGVLSLVFWSLMLVVTLKYVTIIMRANNEGEGGIMALMALAQRTLPRGSRWSYTVGILGVFGASLFFGDGVITPAITVLSALEGIEVIAPQLRTWVVPLAVLILFVVFATQRFGTGKVGRVFGPIMVLWFATLAVIGVLNIQHEPEVLKSLNPMYAVGFFARHGWDGVFILGAVVLAVTGGEALYADMGHFGAKPIRYAWYFFVLPALMLNYLGQGALVLEDPSAIGHPFYIGVPKWGRIPMIVLATAATIIASQSVITGAFSVARQAMQLGYIPRMRIVHTSRETIGQIYIPWINWALMIAVITLVLTFQRSAELASAYGVSVSGTMLIDTLLLALVARAMWLRWRWLVLPLCGLILIVDLAFLVANGVKFFEGAWFPVVLGISLFTLLRTWRRGRQLLHEGVLKEGMQVDRFLPDLMRAPPTRVPGTAIFLSSDPGVVPPAILHNLQHNKVLHERNVFLTVETLDVPYAPPAERLKIDPLGGDFYRVLARYGFMETPDVPRALTRSREFAGIDFDPMETTYFASRETVVAGAQRGMAIWREHLFSLMHRSAAPANGFYRIPGRQLIVVGSQVEI